MGHLVGESISNYSTFGFGVCIGVVKFTYLTNTHFSGCIGKRVGSTTDVSSLYYDNTLITSAKATVTGTTRGPYSSHGVGKTTAELQTPINYTGIYATWGKRDTVGTGSDDEWNFGTASEYPDLREGVPIPPPNPTPVPTPSPTPSALVDYDANDNHLIDVRNAAQLQEIRHDLFHTGVHVTPTVASYAAAFPNAMPNMGCPTGGCRGYELLEDIDLNGVSWTPIGQSSSNS